MKIIMGKDGTTDGQFSLQKLFFIYYANVYPRTSILFLTFAHKNLVITLTTGRDRINTLAENTRFFRTELMKMGFIVYGTVK